MGPDRPPVIGAPRFLVTIDTEGDDLWSRPRTVTTRNAAFLPRFQSLCEAYGIRPTYLTNHEMASCPAFVEFGREVLEREAGEIGMHLHAWNSPPLVPLTDDDLAAQPYVIEYPAPVMREKIARLTGLLEDVFGRKMVSHRAGRWAFDGVYAGLLQESGYQVDCSVTPHVLWVRSTGARRADYRDCPEGPYELDFTDIGRAGASGLLEVPVTVRRRRWPALERLRSSAPAGSLLQRALDRQFPPLVWLRPNGRNRRGLRWLMSRLTDDASTVAVFMLHSSELMPGGSPSFLTAVSIERLYEDMREVFELARTRFEPATVAEFATHWRKRTAASA